MFGFGGIYILSVLAAIILFSEWLQRYRFFRYAGTAILVIVFTAVVANAGVIPTGDHPFYSAVFDYVTPASIFLLLLDVNLRELRKVGMPMLMLFLIGTLGTALGVIAATRIIPESSLFNGFYAPLAGMFAGTYTGGALNFNAVALHYEVMEDGLVFASATAVDNIITTLWMFVTIAVPLLFRKRLRQNVQPSPNDGLITASIDMKGLSVMILLTVFSVWISGVIAAWTADRGVAIPSILIVTTLALIFAQFNVLPGKNTGRLFGSWLIYLFLAVVGAFCDLHALASAGKLALILFAFVLIILAVHGLVLALANILYFKDWDITAIASQANIGGSTTAMALAQSFGRHEIVLPAIIIGAFGNALGTYLGFFIAAIV